MIPKTIHYCWFGGSPLSHEALKCIASWKKIMPEYEIKRWDESNFKIESIPFTLEAYRTGNYAFVSDYARFWILYHHGGIYFDTDVEIIRQMDDVIEKGAFLGCEREAQPGRDPELLSVAPGLGMGAEKGNRLCKKMIDLYESMVFSNDYRWKMNNTVVKHTTALLVNHGLQNTPEIQTIEGISIYPKEYFCPIDIGSRELKITPRTRTIHYYSGSWTGNHGKIKSFVKSILGVKLSKLIVKLKRMAGNG